MYFPFCSRSQFLNLVLSSNQQTWKGYKDLYINWGGNCPLLETRQPLTVIVSAAQPCNPIFWVIVSLGTSHGVRFYSSQSPLWSTLPLVLIYCRFSLWVRWNNLMHWDVSPRRGLGCFQTCFKCSGKDSPFVSNTEHFLDTAHLPRTPLCL